MPELDFELIATAAEGLPVVLTTAPDVAQNSQFIPILRDKGVVVGIGHSEATYEQTMKAIDSGLTHAAHFFNALGGFHHRVPGAVGAVLESEDVTAEIIPDGIHIHPASLKLVIKTKGVRNVCLVTDSIETAGLGEGIFKLRGQEIEVRENRALRCGDGILAGGISNMIRGVRNVMEWTHLSLDQAVRMVSLNPARILGLDSDLGSIVRGKHANLTVFNGDYQIKQVYVYGKPLL